MRLHTLVGVGVLVCALPAVAAEPAHDTKVFAVSHLLGGAGDHARKGERLSQLVRSYVRPHSWTETGGRGSVEFYETEGALVVTNTADVLREMTDLLDAFGRIQSGRAPAVEPLARDLRAAQNPPPVAPAPRAANGSVAVKLRNIAAADAAAALARHFAGKGVQLRVQAEAVSNTVLVSASAADLTAATKLLAVLDAPPKQVLLTAMVIQVPESFIEASGLNIGAKPGTTVWTLSAREAHMLDHVIRAEKAKGTNGIDILSRPQLQVLDNQTGYVQVGQEETGVTLRAKPRVAPDGGVLLRVEAKNVTLGAPVILVRPGKLCPTVGFAKCYHTTAFETTAELKPGEALVARVGGALVVVTPSVVK